MKKLSTGFSFAENVVIFIVLTAAVLIAANELFYGKF